MPVLWDWKRDAKAVALHREALSAARRLRDVMAAGKVAEKVVARLRRAVEEARRLWKGRVKWVVLNGAIAEPGQLKATRVYRNGSYRLGRGKGKAGDARSALRDMR